MRHDRTVGKLPRVAILLLAASSAAGVKAEERLIGKSFPEASTFSSTGLPIAAQDDASFTKKFPDGSDVYLRKESFTEVRSRPSDPAVTTPGRTIMDQELQVNRFSLFLRKPGQSLDALLWSKELIHLKKEPWRSAHGGSFRVADVLFGRERAYVLNHVGDFYNVANIKRDVDGVWFETSSTSLARDLVSQLIFKGEFQPGSKPRIALDYKASGGKYDGQIRRWVWVLNGDCWNRK